MDTLPGPWQRAVPLTRALNLRDIGEYPAADGRRVRVGLVYRSANLAGLTEEDRGLVDGLGLRCVCDLRDEEELASAPGAFASRAPANPTEGMPPIGKGSPSRRWHHAPIKPRLRGDISRLITEGGIDGQTPRGIMTAVYRAFPLEHAPSYRLLLNLLTDSANLPLLFHCTAGKDRTGFGAALILRALGVKGEAIEEDYQLTNSHWSGTGALDSVSEDLREALGRAQPEFLRASFDAIDETFGSFEGYLERGLQMDAVKIERLRSLLLE